MVSHMVIESKAGSSLSLETMSTVGPCVPCVFCIRPVLFDILFSISFVVLGTWGSMDCNLSNNVIRVRVGARFCRWTSVGVAAIFGIGGVAGTISGAWNVATGGTGIDFLALEVERAGGATIGSQEWGGNDAGGTTIGSWTVWVAIVGGIVFGTGSC